MASSSQNFMIEKVNGKGKMIRLGDKSIVIGQRASTGSNDYRIVLDYPQESSEDRSNIQLNKSGTVSTPKSRTVQITPTQMDNLKRSMPHNSTSKSVQMSIQQLSSSNLSHSTPSVLSKKNQSGGSARRNKTEKTGKGLRYFSEKVCKKVEAKGRTNYNEVADELVAEETKSPLDPTNDQKNIRRRVYDALNVLMAINVISKDRKEIIWEGLPANETLEGNSAVEKDNIGLRKRIEDKEKQLHESLMQLIAFKILVARNKEAEREGLTPAQNSTIKLPFIIVNTHKTTQITCNISDSKLDYSFKFDNEFEIHDDVDILKYMGLLEGLDRGQCSDEDIERIKKLVPDMFKKHIEIYGKGLAEDLLYDDMPIDESQEEEQYTEDFNESCVMRGDYSDDDQAEYLFHEEEEVSDVE